MRNLVIAKRYARALFGIAQEEKAVEKFAQALDEFRVLLQNSPDLADAIGNPLYPEDIRRRVFESLAEKVGMEVIFKNFIILLIEKGRIRNLPEICDYYHKLLDDYLNIARAKVKAAIKLDKATMEAISEALEKITGKKVIVEFEQDTSLIGGVVAQIGDLVIDGSVRTQLNTIKESLKRGELG